MQRPERPRADRDRPHGLCLDYVDGTLRVVAEGVVLDEGPKIAALQRRGDRVFWTDDGAERSAPLP